MSAPTYYLKKAGVEEGPLTVTQINRMKQRRQISAETPCRPETETAFRRLDEVFPHLKDYQGLNPEKMDRLKKDMADFEIKSLTAGAFSGGAMFWAPLGIGMAGAITAVVFGAVLLFKYRKPIGIPAMLLGAAGLWLRTARIWVR